MVTPHGIALTAHGTASVARGTGVVRGIEAAHGVVMLRGIDLTVRGTVLTAPVTTVADAAAASAHSTGRHPLPLPGFVAW